MDDSFEHAKNEHDVKGRNSSMDLSANQRSHSSVSPKAASFTDIVTASLEIKDSIKHTSCLVSVF